MGSRACPAGIKPAGLALGCEQRNVYLGGTAGMKNRQPRMPVVPTPVRRVESSSAVGSRVWPPISRWRNGSPEGPSCPAGLSTHRSWGGGAIGVPSCLRVFEVLGAIPSLDLELEAMRPAWCLCCVGSGPPGAAACRLGKEPAAWRQIPRSRSPLGTDVLAGGRSQPEGVHAGAPDFLGR